MGIFCEDCPDPCVKKFLGSYDSSDHIYRGAHALAFQMLIKGRNFGREPGPISKGEQMDPETGMVTGPKIECCNPNVNEAFMVLSAATVVVQRELDTKI